MKNIICHYHYIYQKLVGFSKMQQKSKKCMSSNTLSTLYINCLSLFYYIYLFHKNNNKSRKILLLNMAKCVFFSCYDKQYFKISWVSRQHLEKPKLKFCLSRASFQLSNWWIFATCVYNLRKIYFGGNFKRRDLVDWVLI